jgi:predicted dehydrogenase
VTANVINFGIIGCGGITLQNHLPRLAICPGVKVLALCDSDAGALERARAQTELAIVSRDYKDILDRDDERMFAT